MLFFLSPLRRAPDMTGSVLHEPYFRIPVSRHPASPHLVALVVLFFDTLDISSPVSVNILVIVSMQDSP